MREPGTQAWPGQQSLHLSLFRISDIGFKRSRPWAGIGWVLALPGAAAIKRRQSSYFSSPHADGQESVTTGIFQSVLVGDLHHLLVIQAG